TMGDGAQVVARNRHTHPKLLGRVIRGDLDWIVMKALEKDRGRRYETATGFAMDIGRYLANEPVLASPPSRSYRARKYIRRHRVGVLAAAAVFLALGIGASGATAGYLEARAKAKRANTIYGFLSEVFRASGPEQVHGPKYTVRQQLDDFERRVKDQLAEDPEIEAEIRILLADAYATLGLPDRADAHADRAIAIATPLLGPDHELLAGALRAKGSAAAVRYDPVTSAQHHRDALAMRRRLHGDKHVEVGTELFYLASTSWLAPDFDAAEEAVREALAIFHKTHGDRHMHIASCLRVLGNIEYARGNLDAAVKHLEDSRAMHRSLMTRYPAGLAATLRYLAIAYAVKGDRDRAEETARKGVEIMVRTHGETHPTTIALLQTQGEVYMRAQQFAKAEATLKRVVDLSDKVFGADSRQHGMNVNAYGHCLYGAGQFDRAIDVLKNAEAILRRHAPDHHDLAAVLSALGSAYFGQGKVDLAERCYREALRIEIQGVGEDNLGTATAYENLASVQSARGNHKEAVALGRKSLAVQKAKLGEESPRYINVLTANGQFLRMAGELDEALKVSREALRLARLHAPDDEVRAVCANNVATLLAAGDEAVELAREAATSMVKIRGKNDPIARRATHNYAMALANVGRNEEAAKIFETSFDLAPIWAAQPGTLAPTYATMFGAFMETARLTLAEKAARAFLATARAQLPDGHPGIAQGCVFVGVALLKQKKYADAEPFLIECLTIRKKVFPPEAWLIPNTKSLLGESYLGQGQHENAEPLVLAGYNNMDASQAPPPRKSEALERVIALYESWKKPDKAEEWRKKRDAGK
ncbi:MAG: tetratricopeptide repeat protein, partial [Planctomycetota bacterium]|nr:tetratricopeptide repeat protein [Planctomycetota bacterium]